MAGYSEFTRKRICIQAKGFVQETPNPVGTGYLMQFKTKLQQEILLPQL